MPRKPLFIGLQGTLWFKATPQKSEIITFSEGILLLLWF